ncbi:(2Fe-2S)-binding protein [Cumulibacter manganitolerans]|uniref:(2Fe-2S)-binding protein n=1 Tax=Cumulibacter manganitolerans TaxID=1884992 RepID=UPI001295E93C|nr:(2Fe-2S)-binding protein [Cumulibacter manganitolerans]
MRLKAGAISAVGIGDPRLLDPAGDLRVVSLSDVAARRSVTVAIDGDRLRAAACVGAPAVAAELQVLFERGLPVPADPAHLLIDRTLVAAAPDSTALNRIPDTAAFCRCNGVTKAQIIAAFRAGDRTVADVAARTRATTGCGGCHDAVGDALQWLADADPEQSSTVPAPARATTGAAL